VLLLGRSRSAAQERLGRSWQYAPVALAVWVLVAGCIHGNECAGIALARALQHNATKAGRVDRSQPETEPNRLTPSVVICGDRDTDPVARQRVRFVFRANVLVPFGVLSGSENAQAASLFGCSVGNRQPSGRPSGVNEEDGRALTIWLVSL
jgi:hypothetical protein